MATPITFGSEFLVNTTTTGEQVTAVTTALTGGRFVVTWRDSSQTGADTSGYAIRAQIFNTDGSKSGTEFVVNSTATFGQEQPSITALSSGRFVVAWTDSSRTGGDTDQTAVRAQVFNSFGSTLGGELLANTTTASLQEQSTTTTLASGRFVVLWTDHSATGADSSGTAIRGQIFRLNGTKVGGEFLVNSTTNGFQTNADAVGLVNGSFVASWIDNGAIRSQVFFSNGTKLGAEVLVSAPGAIEAGPPAIAALTDGRYVVTWADGLGGPGDDSFSAVLAQIFNADGTASSGRFVVNTNIFFDQWAPDITALSDGRFLIAWADSSQTGTDTTGQSVRAQLFDANGIKSGAEFLVNTTTAGNQFDASVTELADGRIVISFTDLSMSGGDSSVSAIRSQIFDPREAGANKLEPR